MITKKKVKFFLLFFFLLFLILFIFTKFLNTVEPKVNREDIQETENSKNLENQTYNSNIIKDINYTTKDADGNEYIITALQGEIDFSDPNTLYLINVKALIKLKSSENINITSDFGKYNSENFDTIFSRNVIIKYLSNRITGEYLDFSLNRNSMTISRNVTYNNLKNTLKADVIELNIETKDTKIFMYEKEKKVNIKSRN
tara:strand:+ start:459 stop:1058 length:600 start_codon:yes stop_codon:yes gene_type:complete